MAASLRIAMAANQRMGHSDIRATRNDDTRVRFKDAQAELLRVAEA